MNDLRPCPFCGGVNAVRSTLGADERIRCADCETFGPQGDSVFLEYRDAYAKAITLWNRRVGSGSKGGRFAADTKHGLMSRAGVKPVGREHPGAE